MRLLLTLKAERDFAYDAEYYHKLQGAVYEAIRPLYPQLHDLPGYKFFCFSNIFPLRIGPDGVIPPFKEGERKHLLVSSPDGAFIKALHAGLDGTLNVGEMRFAIEKIKEVKPRLREGCTVTAATPIIIRIPEYRYDEYRVPEEHRRPRYAYWRPPIDFSAFVKQLEENLFKKYKQYHHTETKEFPLFDQFKLKKKPVLCRTVIDGQAIELIGSIWEFPIGGLDRERRRMLEFGLECGFGERNPLGFGFVNVMKEGRDGRTDH